MKEYNSKIIIETYEQINADKTLIQMSNSSINLIELIYFLIRHRVRGFIIDDYLSPIRSKSSLLEALYFQIGLIDMYDLNWDAFQEALENYVKNNDCSIVIIFREGLKLKEILKEEIDILEEIISSLSESKEYKNRLILG